MFRKILIYILFPLAIMTGGIIVYHQLIVLELLGIVERMQNAEVSVFQAGGLTKSSNGVDVASSTELQKEQQTVTQMDGGNSVFDLPHMILVGGGAKNIKLAGKILSIAKYVSTDIMAYAAANVASCDGATCDSSIRSVQINRSQAVLAIDIQFTNKDRMGSAEIDPAKQFRVLIGSDFYTPEAFTNGGTGYIEVPELGTYNATFIVRVPKDTTSFRLLFGEDIQNPTGLFDVNLDAQTIESIGG